MLGGWPTADWSNICNKFAKGLLKALSAFVADVVLVEGTVVVVVEVVAIKYFSNLCVEKRIFS